MLLNTQGPLAFAPPQQREARATIDFETKSQAGFFWDDANKKWHGPPGSAQGKKGLPVIGAAAYAEHPSTDILTLSWKLPDGRRGRWRPGQPLDRLTPLFLWIQSGGLVEAHNVMFERLIWWFVATPRYGFPPLTPERLACSSATARVYSYPGGLGQLGDVLRLPIQKDKEGKRLLNKFSIPRKPTKNDPRFWIDPETDPEGEKLYAYCDTDCDAEELASHTMPEMTPAERFFWLIDQEINWAGIAIDRQGVRDCIAVLNEAIQRYGDEFRWMTGGLDPTQGQKIMGWLAGHGVYTHSLDEDNRQALLARIPAHPEGGINPPRRVMEILDLIGSASVKKLFAMENMAGSDDRLRNLIIHHGARTGRPTGEGPQPLNLPKAGPPLYTCTSCDNPYGKHHYSCPWCGQVRSPKPVYPYAPAWRPSMVPAVLSIMSTRSLAVVEHFFGDAVLAIMGCVRGLFQAGPRKQLVASDYSAIEAVVTAMLAGEDWRIAEFRAKADIYISSASKITGNPVAFYTAYYEEHKEKHPDRQNIGKVAELALGFGGWIGAWRNFDSSDTFTDADVKKLILAWRDASPAIVEMWGGQWRGPHWDSYPCLFGFEGAAIAAARWPGQVFDYAGIKFQVRPGVFQPDAPGSTIHGHPGGRQTEDLVITLLSGRELTYHDPLLTPSDREYDKPGTLSLSYMTYNTNPKYGPMGWVRMNTYGGRLTENIVQATAHDILRFAIINLRAAGFPTVLHVYDEIVVEVDEDLPDDVIAEVERIMCIMPPWAANWPIRAAGGWRGKRYRKD